MGDIKVTDVLRKGFGLYKDNFRILFGVSVLYTIIQCFDSVVTLLNGYIKNGVLFFAGIIVTLVVLYLSIRLMITIIIVARDLFKEREITIGFAFADAHQYFWSYVGNSILASLPMIIPIAIGISVQLSEMPFLNKLPIFAVLALIAAIISSFFYFAPISVALEPGLQERISNSIKLVKGKLLIVLATLFFCNFIFAVPSFIITFTGPGITSTPYMSFIRSMITNLINLVSLPFTICTAVVLYYELSRLKNIDSKEYV